MRKLFLVTIAIATLAALPKPADAATVLGVLSVTGGVVRVTADSIDFFPVGGGSGTATVAAGQTTGYFTFLIGQTVVEQDLDETTFPVGEDIFLAGFETFPNYPSLTFDLTKILTCTSCAPGFEGTPFNFDQQEVAPGLFNTSISFNLNGLVTDTAVGGFTNLFWTGIFTAQFPGESIADVLARFEATGSIDASFSAAKITLLETPVPEPATLILLGSGLLGTAFRARRRRSR